MSIVGLGTDIVDVARLTRLIDRGGRRFLERWFRKPELEACFGDRPDALHIAAVLATKEAAAKSLRVPPDIPVPWHDIEVTPEPGLRLHGRMATLAVDRGACTFHVSMAHTPDHAVATVVALSSSGQDPL